MAITDQQRQIRIFLSSTFADMQDERDYLVKKVFPSIQEICEKRNVDFSVLDLRWGITEEESCSGKVIEICMEEIDNTRPYFIGLIGGRYGWVPQEKEFAVNERLLTKYPWLKKAVHDKLSITEMEMQYGVLDNPENINAFFFLRDPESVPEKYREKQNSEDEKKLSKLRTTIREKSQQGKCSTDDYSSLEQLGKKVFQRLMVMIDAEFPKDDDSSIFAYALKRQGAILKKLRTNYVDHDNRLLKLDDFLNRDTDYKVKIIAGDSGSGKSSLLANWNADDVWHTYQDIWAHKETQQPEMHVPIIRTSATEEINTADMLRRFFLYQIREKNCSL